MKSQIALCSLAFNPASPSPTASMVRVSDGQMTAFGGTFCISVPLPMEIGACFNPRAVANFFRKERGPISYKLNKNKLVLKEGKEQLSVSFLAPEEMEVIDNIETPVPATLNMKLLKIATEISDPENSQLFAKGVNFREGLMNATNNKVFFSGESGLPEDCNFTLCKTACVALTKFKSKVVSVIFNKFTVKFIFEDGSSLCSKQQICEFPNIDSLFEGDWIDFELKEELSDITCDHLEFINGSAYYHTDASKGVVAEALSSKINVSVYKKSFDFALMVGNKLSLSDNNLRIKSTGDNCVVVCSVKVPD